MVNQAFPSLNDIEPSWADIAVTAAVTGTPGIPTGGPLIPMGAIAAIKWSRKVDLGKRRGASGGRVTARTTGEGDQDASMTLYRSGLRTLIKGLLPLAPRRGRQAIISLVAFDIMIQHTPPGEFEIYQTKIKGCRYLGESDDMKEGPDADKLEVPLSPIEIVQIIDGQEVVLL